MRKLVIMGLPRRKATSVRQLRALTGLRNLANWPALAIGTLPPRAA
jgi:hypothetical protein